MILSPYFWIAALLAALTIFGTGYHNGYKNATNSAESLQLQAVAKAQTKAIEQAKRDQATAQTYETARETVRTIYVKVKEKAHANIAQNPGYDHCSLDADGLQLYNHNPNTAAPAAAGAHGPMSGSADRTGRQDVDDPGHQPGALATVLRLPGAPQGAVGLGGHITVGGE